MPTADGRVRHYGTFYGVSAAGTDATTTHPADQPVRPDAPLVLVHGNCQAESIRVLLATAPTRRTRRCGSRRSSR